MTHYKIFLRGLFGLLFALFLQGNTYAVTASAGGYAFPQSPTYGAQGPTLSSYDAACSWGFNQYKNTTSGDPKWNGWASYAVTGALCNMKWSSGGVANSYSMVYVAPSCPANSTGTAPTCVCKAGFIDKGTSCTAPNNQDNCSSAAVLGSSSFGQTRITAKISSGTSLCVSHEANAPGVGCRVDLLDTGIIKLPDGTRIVQGYPRRTNTGADTCPISTDPTVPKTEKEVTDSPQACANGQMGTVNGRTVCVKYLSGTTTTTTSPASTTTTTNKNPDGSPAPVDPNSEVSASDIGQKQCVTGTCTTTTTTTTTKGDGSTTTKVTTSTGPDGSASDTPFGSVPVLYESKYPDGLSGVWSTQTAAMKNSQVGKLMTSLTPTFQSGGSCPTWPIDLDFGRFGSWGSPNVAPPCWIWPLAKIFTIIGALILARALIFGG